MYQLVEAERMLDQLLDDDRNQTDNSKLNWHFFIKESCKIDIGRLVSRFEKAFLSVERRV